MATSNLQPIREIPGDETKQPRQGMALCLSGGGYRAMVFHLGSLWRLNEAGLLKKLSRISSVSGGSRRASPTQQQAFRTSRGMAGQSYGQEKHAENTTWSPATGGIA
jgi:hypothetical protein